MTELILDNREDEEEEEDSDSSYEPDLKPIKRNNYTKHHKVRMPSSFVNNINIPESIDVSNMDEISQLLKTNDIMTTKKCLELISEVIMISKKNINYNIIRAIGTSKILPILSDLLNVNDNDIKRLITKCLDDMTDCGYIEPILKHNIHKQIIHQIHDKNTLIQIDSLSILGNIALKSTQSTKNIFFSSDINILDHLLQETNPTKHYDILYFISFLISRVIYSEETQHIPKILDILNILIMYDDGYDIIEEAIKGYSKLMDVLMEYKIDDILDISTSMNAFVQKSNNNKKIFDIIIRNWNTQLNLDIPIPIIKLCQQYFDVFQKEQVQIFQFDLMHRFTMLLDYNTNIQEQALECIEVITGSYVLEDKYYHNLTIWMLPSFIWEKWYDKYFWYYDVQRNVFTILKHISKDKCVYIRKAEIIDVLMEVVLSDRKTCDGFEIDEAAFSIICECMCRGDNEMKKCILNEGFISTFIEFVSKVSSRKIIHEELMNYIETTLTNMIQMKYIMNNGQDIKLAIKNEGKRLQMTDIVQENNLFISRCITIIYS